MLSKIPLIIFKVVLNNKSKTIDSIIENWMLLILQIIIYNKIILKKFTFCI